MKNKKIWFLIGIIIILAIVLSVILYCVISGNKNTKSSLNNFKRNFDNSSTITEETVIANIEIEENTVENVDYSNYTGKVNLSQLTVSGSGVSILQNTITITLEGTYYFTGTAQNANIVVNAGDNDNVILVFENANITSSTTSVINGINAKKIIINLVAESTNTFTDSSNYTVFTEDDEPDGTVFSKTDLAINGTGTLVVNANYKDGIVSKDELTIIEATLNVTSADDGIRGTDSVGISNANITVNAKSDGIKSNGIVQINSGTFNITAGEGIEATYVKINDGTINISASDDGINASNKSTDYSTVVEINGGYITIKMGSGDTDGIDANGNLYINGGTIDITGNSAFDYDGTAQYNGGTLIVNGTQTNTITNQFMGGGPGGGMQPWQEGIQQQGEMPPTQGSGRR